MGARLDDTAREALQFLLLGAGSILLGRLLYSGSYHHLDPSGLGTEAEALAPFRNGYLLTEGHTLVANAIAVEGRMALAALLTLLFGCAVAAVVWVIARLIKAPARRSVLTGVRFALATSSLWCLYAALFLPPAATHIEVDGLRIVKRPAFLGQLSLPLVPERMLLSWEDVRSVGVRRTADPLNADGERVQVIVVHGTRSIVVADLALHGTYGNVGAATEDCQRLATLLRLRAGGT